jgi:hypothetical protein
MAQLSMEIMRLTGSVLRGNQQHSDLSAISSIEKNASISSKPQDMHQINGTTL